MQKMQMQWLENGPRFFPLGLLPENRLESSLNVLRGRIPGHFFLLSHDYITLKKSIQKGGGESNDL